MSLIHFVTYTDGAEQQVRYQATGDSLKPAALALAPPLSSKSCMPEGREGGSGPTHAVPEIHTSNLSCQRAHESPGKGIITLQDL